ncbi:MAG TPA: hypothetical protein VJN90_08495 [Candidatus Acidoferrales bacterium]|nr:hypothetical protein [Candidatus Acidoferrales bacterium]
MERVKIFARAIALLGLLTWCVSFSWASQGQGQKPPAKTPGGRAAASTPSSKPAVSRERDPFAALIQTGQTGGGHLNLPPGIAGLQISTLRMEGMVRTPEGMVAVVANPEDRVYFLHDGDHLYDGVVEKIGMDDIVFRQESKDAFGRAMEREVSKRLYPIAGDEQ